MTTLDDLIEQRQKLTELIRMAKLFNGKIKVGDELTTLVELKESLTELKIGIESRRSNFPPLRRVK